MLVGCSLTQFITDLIAALLSTSSLSAPPETCDGPGGGGVFGFVGLPVVGEPERRLVGGVVAQHVEDEALLDGLLHRVQVERVRHAVDALVPEQLQGLGLRGGGEREERQVLRLGPGGHLRRQHVLGVDGAAVLEIVQLGGRQGRLEPLGGFPGLRRVGLVGDDREVLALQVGLGADQLQGEGEGLDGDDDDLRPARQRVGQLLRLRPAQPGDVGDHPWGAVDLADRLLQLRIQHVAVGDHDDRVEHRLVGLVVQHRQPVRQPGDAVGLAGPCRVLDQVPVPRPLLSGWPRPAGSPPPTGGSAGTASSGYGSSCPTPDRLCR